MEYHYGYQRRWNILVFVNFLGENMLDAFPKTSNNDYNQNKIKGDWVWPDINWEK